MQITLELVRWFIEEREAIRMGKTTDDPVLLNSRFCNIHREDDKVSKWIFENCSTIRQVCLSRLTNRLDLLDELYGLQWSINGYLDRDGPVTNAGAYQFYPRKGETIRDIIRDIDSQMDTIEQIFAIADGQDISIKDLALNLSNHTGRPLHFYWMMVILDLGHMGLANIDMNSEVYMGPGGKKILKGLDMDLKQTADALGLPQYTTEHALCEVRKYVERTENGIPNNRKR